MSWIKRFYTLIFKFMTTVDFAYKRSLYENKKEKNFTISIIF